MGGFWCSESLAELFLPSMREDSLCITFSLFCFFPHLRQLHNSTEAENWFLAQQKSPKPLCGSSDPFKERRTRGIQRVHSIQTRCDWAAKAAGEAKAQTTQHQGWALNQKPFPPNTSSFSFRTGLTSSLFFHWEWEEIWLHMIHK